MAPPSGLAGLVWKHKAHRCCTQWEITRQVLRTTLLTSFSINMQLKHILSTSLFAFVAAAGVCDSGLYQALSPLATYAPAKSFCTQRYPPGTTTVTVTNGAVVKRSGTTSKTTATQARSTTKTSTKATVTVVTSTTSKTTSTKATTTKDSKAVAWSSLSAQAGAILSTFCSCVQPLKTVSLIYPGASQVPAPC